MHSWEYFSAGGFSDFPADFYEESLGGVPEWQQQRNRVTEEEPQKPLPDVKIREKTDQKTGEKAGSYQRIPDRDHFADNSGGFDHIDHQ
ncbi:hypothetical protein RUMOBE_03155 [Blautia obeum ATCC 29174]|uniref:Uncharacterized protein n=1 Tax=Blautia obeum ATCC 29174 TaxID=411459 RepID=A5ZVW2_9FIRM|nr:hypothetical protein RUMOBE_03155 [Blautia obeum ATCC 29174]